jgi:hypothetical protein
MAALQPWRLRLAILVLRDLSPDEATTAGEWRIGRCPLKLAFCQNRLSILARARELADRLLRHFMLVSHGLHKLAISVGGGEQPLAHTGAREKRVTGGGDRGCF